jgi:hypothetical protein
MQSNLASCRHPAETSFQFSCEIDTMLRSGRVCPELCEVEGVQLPNLDTHRSEGAQHLFRNEELFPCSTYDDPDNPAVRFELNIKEPVIIVTREGCDAKHGYLSPWSLQITLPSLSEA